jgi:hypothetical protein
MNLYYCPFTALYTRFTSSIMLAHESLPLVFVLPYPQGLQHLSCRPMHICYCLGTALSTRFTASVLLAHKSVLLSLFCLLHEIHSICHAGSKISSAIFALPYPQVLQYPRNSQHLSCWPMHLCCCPFTALYTRFATSVMVIHQSLLLSLHYPIYEIHSICHAGSWVSACLSCVAASVMLA